MGILSKISKNIALDLGTSNTLVYVAGKGIVIQQPSIVAINNRTEHIVAVGDEAKKMLGKTPPHIVINNPLTEGVIADFEVAEKMIKYFIDQVQHESFSWLPRPIVVIGIPLDVTEVERKAVIDATKSAGAREVYLVYQPLLTAIGVQLPVTEASGNLIVEMGGGVTEIAVISLGGIVTSTTLPIAGRTLDEQIINYVRENFNLLLGEASAEEIKIKLATVGDQALSKEMNLRGRDMLTGLPREVIITSFQIKEAIIKPIKRIIEAIRDTLAQTPPELVAEIYQRGLVLSGGGAYLDGLAALIQKELKIPVHLADDPLTTVIRGLGIVLEDLANLKDLTLTS
ncbi:MAG: rod shape-determining protein [Candidatus Komeilibacteria bacterium]|nr:rod shape-determining protein [Candidatus Komeilibacteria bacterium]